LIQQFDSMPVPGMTRAAEATVHAITGRSFPAKPICKLSRPLISPDCHVGARGWEKPT
jgi:hypothetical protein